MCVCVCACVRACVRARARVRVCIRVCVHVCTGGNAADGVKYTRVASILYSNEPACILQTADSSPIQTTSVLVFKGTSLLKQCECRPKGTRDAMTAFVLEC